jgi:hypothetical protein
VQVLSCAGVNVCRCYSIQVFKVCGCQCMQVLLSTGVNVCRCQDM